MSCVNCFKLLISSWGKGSYWFEAKTKAGPGQATHAPPKTSLSWHRSQTGSQCLGGSFESTQAIVLYLLVVGIVCAVCSFKLIALGQVVDGTQVAALQEAAPQLPAGSGKGGFLKRSGKGTGALISLATQQSLPEPSPPRETSHPEEADALQATGQEEAMRAEQNAQALPCNGLEEALHLQQNSEALHANGPEEALHPQQNSEALPTNGPEEALHPQQNSEALATTGPEEALRPQQNSEALAINGAEKALHPQRNAQALPTNGPQTDLRPQPTEVVMGPTAMIQGSGSLGGKGYNKLGKGPSATGQPQGPPQRLTPAAVDRRLRRVMAPRTDGTFKVPENAVADWKDLEKRHKIKAIFEKCGYCKD